MIDGANPLPGTSVVDEAEQMIAALKLAVENERIRDEGIIELEVRMRAMELRLARMEQQLISHMREAS